MIGYFWTVIAVIFLITANFELKNDKIELEKDCQAQFSDTDTRQLCYSYDSLLCRTHAKSDKEKFVQCLIDTHAEKRFGLITGG